MPYRQIHLTSVDSTNNYLLRLLQSGETISNLVVFADFQTNGRGMESNGWYSSAKTNLLFSLGVDVSFLPAASQFLITQAVSTAIVTVLEKIIPNKKISIKWPNDIYFEDKKLAGILISNTVLGDRLGESVIGAGLNINEEIFPEHLPNPVSLYQITNQKFELLILLKQLSKAIFQNIINLNKPKQIEWIRKSYTENLFRYMEVSTYIIDGKRIQAKIIGYNEYGYLMLENESKDVYVCNLKQVRFVI